VALNWQQNTHFYMERRMRTMKKHSFFLRKRITSAIKKFEFVTDRMSCIILRSHWFHIILLNVRASTEDKTDDMKVNI
jgi:hypothetical protein